MDVATTTKPKPTVIRATMQQPLVHPLDQSDIDNGPTEVDFAADAAHMFNLF
jgi:hypothetical protein